MTDDNNTPKPEETPAAPQEQPVEKTEEAAPAAGDAEAEAKARAAAEAKAKAAAAAKAKAEAEAAKAPWETKPVAPEHEEAMDDPDVAALAEALPEAVAAADRFAGDVTATISRERIVEACRFLKEEQGYLFLVDLTAVDWPEREEGRFDVIYWMHRFDDSKRLRLRVILGADEAIPTVTGVWKVADWMEREAFDMFGIIFEGHPNLERILTWEGFNGHPLRKDFPIEGIDTGAAIYPDVYPPGGGPPAEEVEGEAT